jgi:hypothetical protein
MAQDDAQDLLNSLDALDADIDATLAFLDTQIAHLQLQDEK